MTDGERSDEHFEQMLGVAKETLERDQLIKEMLDMLPADLVSGFISDQLVAIDKTLAMIEQAIQRFTKLKESPAVDNFKIWQNKLLQQKQLLLDKQKGA
ncbi:MAG TPA: hypothetical protein VE973_01055 [Candidatus Limnocylindria bacterium]|nr:hypothetical protein [Candidatus Limnocylindria bacterium]